MHRHGAACLHGLAFDREGRTDGPELWTGSYGIGKENGLCDGQQLTQDPEPFGKFSDPFLEGGPRLVAQHLPRLGDIGPSLGHVTQLLGLAVDDGRFPERRRQDLHHLLETDGPIVAKVQNLKLRTVAVHGRTDAFDDVTHERVVPTGRSISEEWDGFAG